jgi:asparagine synthase (glutamine-hydrolysing)
VSGTAAIFSRGGAPADAALLARMIEAQRFRGPDGQGSWRDGSVGLGHALHKTTVEAEREVSPTTLDGRLVVTADARIDARQELCAQLRDHGRDIPIDLPDPELVLHAYDAWGEGCVERLLGDFSFALWDTRRRRLVCAVDAVGARAFYYADRGGLFVGSNSLRCVRLHPGVRDELDERAVGDFLLFGCHEDRGRTMYADVARIPPGHLLVVDEEGTRLRRYFEWPRPAEAHRAKPDECVDEFRELLGRAVRDRLRTPKVAIMMSGGVDSPVVALTAKRELERRFAAPELRAYCAVYDYLIPDEERHYAGMVASSLGIPIDFQPLDEAEVFDWVGRLAPGEPPADSMIGPFFEQLLRITRHTSVVLTGYDGDTLLRAALRMHWRERVAERRFGMLAQELIWYVWTQRALPPMGVRTAIEERRRRRPARRPSWLREDFWRRAELAEVWSRGLVGPEISGSRDPSALGFAGRAWGSLLDAHDPGHLGVPIDFRHPLLDLRLVRFALTLRAVPWCVDKHLLRRCMADLPAAIRRRPKTPLAVDPLTAVLRRRSLASVRVPEPSPQWESFVDREAVKAALGGPSAAVEDAAPLLRAVSLGTWLQQRDGGAARSRAKVLP